MRVRVPPSAPTTHEIFVGYFIDCMNISSKGLFAGPLIAILLVVGTTGLAFVDPGYSQMRQTISEIGSLSSPLRVPFAILMFGIGTLELILAAAVRNATLNNHRSQATACLIALSAVWLFGIAIFADPHPLHGPFGYVGLVAMLSPIVFSITWRREPRARIAVGVSWALGVIVWAGIITFAFFAQTGALESFGGVIQRSFLYSWGLWCAVIGILLQRMQLSD
jgi:hypothetical membrane protein